MKCYGGGGGEFESRAVLRDSPQWERVTGAICDLLWFLLLIKMWFHPRHFFKARKTAGQLQMINNDWHLTPGHQGVGEAAAN